MRRFRDSTGHGSGSMAAAALWGRRWHVPLRRCIVAVCACVSLPSISGAAERAVELELVLAADVSGSMDVMEVALQRQGYVRAFRHADVVAAIRGTGRGRIAVTYVEWAGAGDQRTLVDWTEISDAGSAAAFAAALERPGVRVEEGTSISRAIAFGAARFDGNGFRAKRRIIDISGDGPNNMGGNVATARDRALAAGIVINGLPIMGQRPSASGFPVLADLDAYYQDCVIGGPGAFIVVAEGFDDFARAIRRKLVLEIAGAAPPAPVLRPAAERVRPPCDWGERQRRGWMSGID